MGYFPPYQPMSFTTPKCGVCDKVFINLDELKTQYKSEYELINESKFDDNPFSIMPTLVEIDFTNQPTEQGGVGGGDVLVLYSKKYCYVFYYKTGIASNYIATNIEDGLIYVEIRKEIDIADTIGNTLLAINITIGSESEVEILAGIAGTTLKIFNYLDNCNIYWNFNTLSMITLIPQNQDGIDYFFDNMYYNPTSQSMCFYNISLLISGAGTSQPKVFFNLLDNTGTTGLLIRTRYTVTNNLDFDINLNTIFKDSGSFIYPSGTYNEIVLAGETKQIEIIHIQPNTFTATTNGQIQINIQGVSPDNLNILNNGVCIDDFSYEALDFISSVEKVDCSGAVTDADYTSEIVGENQLITIDTPMLTGTYYFIFTTVLGDVFTSNSYILNDVNSCSKLIKIKWSHDCNYKDINYNDLDFDNEIYLRGYLTALPLEISEEKKIINSKGVNTPIFSISQDAYELKIANYSEVVHKLLAHVFRHNNISIDDISYIPNDSYSFTRTANTYIGKVNLLEVGTELINSKCCD